MDPMSFYISPPEFLNERRPWKGTIFLKRNESSEATIGIRSLFSREISSIFPTTDPGSMGRF